MVNKSEGDRDPDEWAETQMDGQRPKEKREQTLGLGVGEVEDRDTKKWDRLKGTETKGGKSKKKVKRPREKDWEW